MLRRAFGVAVLTVLGASAVSGLERPRVPFQILFTSTPQLPNTARRALQEEATAIWRRQGVELVWLPAAGAAEPEARRLRVLVVSRSVQALHGGWPVGELVPLDTSGAMFATGRAIAIVSLDGAKRVLTTAGVSQEPAALLDHRLGVILGRALAHEVGHFLLRTRTHARYGLMRARVDVSDFADLRAGTFFLDRDAGSWIRASMLDESTGAASDGAFSYGSN